MIRREIDYQVTVKEDENDVPAALALNFGPGNDEAVPEIHHRFRLFVLGFLHDSPTM
jgi:hypothetical protein